MRIHKIKNRKITLITLAIFAAVAICVGIYFLFIHKTDDFSGTAGISQINYGPPTKEESSAGNEQKAEAVKQQERDQQTTPDSVADVFITDASYYADSNAVEIRAYISNLYESGGTCTATLTQGTQTLTKTSSAFKDATTTQCGALNVPRTDFPTNGTWALTLTYNSDTATGKNTDEVKL